MWFSSGLLDNPPGGRPTKEQAEEKRIGAEAAKERIEKEADNLVKRAISVTIES